MFGSTRAEVQRWQVDLERMSAECTTVGQRQLHPTAKAVTRNDLRAIAEEIASLIRRGEKDHRFDWTDANTVHVVGGRIIPSVWVQADGRKPPNAVAYGS